jgi:drug/metabolite transporter (DMT)-like permease
MPSIERPAPNPATAARSVDLPGAAMIVVSAFAYSTLAIFGKIALGEGMNLPSLLALRFALAAAVLAIIVLAGGARRGGAPPPAPPRRVELFLCGLVGLAGQSGLFFAALQRISASLAEVLLYTCPAFLAINIWILRRRRPEGAVIAAIVLCLAGTWLVTAPVWDGASALGIGLGLGAGLWFSGFALALDRASRGTAPLVSALYIVAGAAIAYALALPFTEAGWSPPGTRAAIAAVGGMVITATLLGLPLFVAGMRRTGPQVAAVLSTFEPVGTLFLAAIFLGERLLSRQWAGAACVVGAAFLLVLRSGEAGSPEPVVSEGALRIDPEPPAA